VLRWLGAPSGNGWLLDFASGDGRHVAVARAAGYRVTAADRDRAALAQAAAVGAETVEADLENGRWPFADRCFEVVVMTRFLHRARLQLLLALLEPGGRLIAETFLSGQASWGRPRNPSFLLGPDELFAVCRRGGLVVLGFEQGIAAGPAAVQRIAAIRPPFDPRAWSIDPALSDRPERASSAAAVDPPDSEGTDGPDSERDRSNH
jgi:SAM-dependent methyltransferase